MQDIKIKVTNGKYVLVRVNGNTESPVRNWKACEPAARRAVFAQSRSTMHGGLYECPPHLARQAQ